MKKVILLFCINLLFLSQATCQDKVEWPSFRGNQYFSQYVEWQLNMNDCINVSYCEEFIGSLKFVLDEKGMVDYGSIKVSENITGCIRSVVRDVLLSSNGTWEPMKINGIAVKSKSMIQLIHFRLEGNCTIKEKYIAKNDIMDSFHDIFNFDKPEKLEDVKVLHPASVYVPTGAIDLGDSTKKENDH